MQTETSIQKKGEISSKKRGLLFIVVLLVTFILLLGGWTWYNLPSKTIVIEDAPTPKPSVTNQTPVDLNNQAPKPKNDLAEILRVSEKVPGTQIHFSNNLGVAFSYALSYNTNGIGVATTTEVGNRIYIYRTNPPDNPRGNNGFVENDQLNNTEFIEVVHKDPNQSLLEAVRETYLKSHEATCTISEIDEEFSGLKYSLIFQPKEAHDLDDPRRDSACPRLGGYDYFFTELPGRSDIFLLLGHGQDLMFSDGFPTNEEGRHNPWYLSIVAL